MSWRQTTPHYRQGGQWVSMGSGGGGGGGDGTIPARFYQTQPSRSGGTITYPADGHSSLQAAYEALGEGDTLVIESGTHTERIQLASNPTDHVTITGEGNRDTILDYPDENHDFTIGMDTEDVDAGVTTDTSLAAAHTSNETTLQVADASPFVGQEGESIEVLEETTPYGYSGGAPPEGDNTVEYATIASVDDTNDTIELEHPLHLPYPNNSTSSVGVVDWTVDDIRITNLTIYGTTSASRNYIKPFLLTDTRHVWADDLSIERSTNDGMLTRISYSHRPRFNNIDFNNGDRYGLDVVQGTTDACATNMSATNIARYVTRWGRPPPGAPGGFGRNIYGTDYDNFTANAHLGGYHVDYEEVHADNCGAFRCRSRDINIDGFTEENSSHRTIILGQIPEECTIKNGTVTNKVNDYVFYSDIGHSNWGYSWARDITFENIEIDAYDGRGPGDIGHFYSGGGEFRGDLIFRDIMYDGSYLTTSDVQNWDNYGAQNINNLVVTTT